MGWCGGELLSARCLTRGIDMVLNRVRVQDLTPDDLLLLTRICSMGYNGTTEEELMRAELQGTYQFWSLPKSLFVLGFAQHPAGKELIVWGFAGEGVVKARKEIMEDLEQIAVHNGCRWIGGYGDTTNGHKWLYEGLGLKPWAVYYVKELGDVPVVDL